jgi:hypothetical protein
MISSVHLTPAQLRIAVRRRLRSVLLGAGSLLDRGELAIFHEFERPPAGGGHQFLRALRGEVERRGIRTQANLTSSTTKACLYNSFNFDARALRRARRRPIRMVHRVDGPIAVYRGFDDGSDDFIRRMNDFADSTVFQSRYSCEKHLELGIELANPVVISNAVDPAIFHPRGRTPFSGERRLRVITTSWSDNPNKGGETYSWLDGALDPALYEYTFVGRITAALRRTRVLPPVSPEKVAAELRAHDVFVTASRNEACSNAVLEALACGLPVVYVRSGSHAELVGKAGYGFDDSEEIPGLLQRLREEYPARQAAIDVPTIEAVADQYLEVLQMQPHA